MENVRLSGLQPMPDSIIKGVDIEDREDGQKVCTYSPLWVEISSLYEKDTGRMIDAKIERFGGDHQEAEIIKEMGQSAEWSRPLKKKKASLSATHVIAYTQKDIWDASMDTQPEDTLAIAQCCMKRITN